MMEKRKVYTLDTKDMTEEESRQYIAEMSQIMRNAGVLPKHEWNDSVIVVSEKDAPKDTEEVHEEATVAEPPKKKLTDAEQLSAWNDKLKALLAEEEEEDLDDDDSEDLEEGFVELSEEQLEEFKDKTGGCPEGYIMVNGKCKADPKSKARTMKKMKNVRSSSKDYGRGDIKPY